MIRGVSQGEAGLVLHRADGGGDQCAARPVLADQVEAECLVVFHHHVPSSR